MKKNMLLKTVLTALMVVFATLGLTSCPGEPENEDYDFIYEVVNKSDKKIKTAVFISDSSKYDRANPDAAIVETTSEVQLVPGQTHQFKFNTDSVVQKYGTAMEYGFYWIPEGGSRSRGYMNGVVYGRGRKHTVTINEQYYGVNSWSLLPGNPIIKVHGCWESFSGAKQSYLHLKTNNIYDWITIEPNSKTSLNGSWSCDSEKISIRYYDLTESSFKTMEIPYTCGTDSIELTIDGVKATWTASTTFEVDCTKYTTERKWSDLAEVEDGKYVYYSYRYNKLPKQYWDYEDSLVFYKVDGNEIASMYYEDCTDAIQTALNNEDFFVSDFDGGCLVLNKNPQSKQNSGSGTGQASNQSDENPKLQEEGYIKLDMSKYATELASCDMIHIDRKAEGSDKWIQVMLYEGWSNGNKLESDVVLTDYYVNKGTKYSYRMNAYNYSYDPIDLGTFTAENGLGEMNIINGKATYDETEHALVFSKLPVNEPEIVAGEGTHGWILYMVEGSTSSEFVYFYPRNIQDNKLYLKSAVDVEKFLGKKIVPYDVKYQVSKNLKNNCHLFWVMEIPIAEDDTSYPEITIPANKADFMPAQ